METTIREILKNYMPSNELKQRFNNKQLKLNNEVVTDLNQVLSIDPDFSMDLGDFIFYQIDNRLKHITVFGNIRDWFGDFDTNVERFKFLGAYHVLEFSKKDAIVFLRKPSTMLKVMAFTEEEEVKLIEEVGTDAIIGLPLDIFYYYNELDFWFERLKMNK